MVPAQPKLSRRDWQLACGVLSWCGTSRFSPVLSWLENSPPQLRIVVAALVCLVPGEPAGNGGAVEDFLCPSITMDVFSAKKIRSGSWELTIVSSGSILHVVMAVLFLEVALGLKLLVPAGGGLPHLPVETGTLWGELLVSGQHSPAPGRVHPVPYPVLPHGFQ